MWRLWRPSRAQDELASGRSNDLDKSKSRTFYAMSSVFEKMGSCKSRAIEAPSRKTHAKDLPGTDREKLR